MIRWLAILAFVATPALADSNVMSLPRDRPTSFPTSTIDRDVTLCLVPDIQNMTSMNDGIAISPSTDCSQTPGLYCTGASCTSSPYCYQTWWKTGEILLRNMAYSLVGKWDQIDYSQIDGNDNVVSKRSSPLDHANCDAIIGLGDNMDSTDTLNFPELSVDQRHEYDAALMFWEIIDASGIPYIIARGNHDGQGTHRQMLETLGVASKSFHYLTHTFGEQYAILFETATGKPFCIVTMDFNGGRSGDLLTPGEIIWTGDTIGCGGDYPTMIARHELVGVTGTLIGTDVSGWIADAAKDELFLLAGGHHTPTPALSYKGSQVNVSGNSVWKFFSNWQEVDRHNTNQNGTGITTSDGAGGAYTIITISPGNQRICAHDWNPYWQTRTGVGNGQDNGAQIMTDYCADFDFDARYP